MPSKDPETRQRKHDYDRPRVKHRIADRDGNRDRDRPKSPRHNSTKAHQGRSDRRASFSGESLSGSDFSQSQTRPDNMLVPEMERRKPSTAQPRPSTLPYPSFSKAHSREAVNGTDEGSRSKPDPITPDSTDIGNVQPPKSAPPRTTRPTPKTGQAPPSPPLTSTERDLRRAGSGGSMRQAAADGKGSHTRRKSADHDEVYGKAGFSASRTSLRQAEEGVSVPRAPPPKSAPASKASFLGFFKDRGDRGGLASGKKPPLNGSLGKSHTRKTSQRGPVPIHTEAHPSLAPNSSRRPPTLLSNTVSSHSDDDLPRTPKWHEGPPRTPQDRKATPIIEVFTSNGSDSDFDVNVGPPTSAAPSPPPPPPPPAVAPRDIPRVDYLLQNGGLASAVSRSFASALQPHPPPTYLQYMSPQPGAAKHNDIRSTFTPFHKLLEDFSSVMAKNGSIAVATGYRSVARRLLDRLESVFARNISSETCHCALCNSRDQTRDVSDEANEVSWGEVLELVSGRRELPSWPPFLLANPEQGLGISASGRQTPMQKLDMDVPEEYREHYIRQSKKTKQAVDNWLACQPEDHASPPQEIDDETLTFAMLTNLEPSQRRLFTALLRGQTAISDSRSPTPMQAGSTKPNSLSMTGIALQRLYRLPRPPRDPECSMFLLKNQTIHNALATLAAISKEEWEILVSGRIDDFLGTPAGEDRSTSTCPSLAPPRGPTPPSRTATPGGGGTSPQPPTTSSTQVDEDTEIAVLAEVEREIYLGMESLEDAFEALHTKAESVRRALRERSAGLALQAQNNRGGGDGEKPEARLGTPAIGTNNNNNLSLEPPVWRNGHVSVNGLGSLGQGVDDDDGGLDERSELAPDDSASNIGWKERERKRHKKRRPGASRRTERRTPAPVEELDEG